MLDYRINTFLTLYKEMNYRRTAEILNMTQPGVTQHIQYLEKYYGIKLFEYNGRVLKRTPDAENIHRAMERMLSEERQLFESFAGGSKLSLKIGATKTIGEYALTDTICAFLKPEDHTLEMTVDNTEKLLEKLMACEIDFALVEGVFDKARYEYHLYKREKFVGVCSKKHPFAGKEIPMEALFQETIAVREKGSGTRRLLEQALMDRGFSLEAFKRVVSVSIFSMLASIVADNQAISFAYLPVASSNPELATFEIKDVKMTGEFNFVYLNRETAMPKINALMMGQ